ncbi:MAG TPA: polysaccharide biosynthesis/export family protein [Bacteroidales bacterium]|nr:polysaccharide biosynthesis/export family protein [Bacteroidales bacterium]
MKRFLYLLVFIVFASGCRVFAPSQMLRVGDYPISEFTDSIKTQEYIISPNDELQISIYTKDGERLIDPISTTNLQLKTENKYLVEFDGQVKLPILNRVVIAGKTIRQAEMMLEERYATFFNNPFVQLKVTNNRVTIFPGGEGSQAMVLTLDNTNTTLFEALAKAGGIQDGKAHKIRLIRGDLKNPKVYVIDLSTIKGMTEANLVLQANDIIYVEPRNKIPQKILENITPYLSLLTTFLLIYQIFAK